MKNNLKNLFRKCAVLGTAAIAACGVVGAAACGGNTDETDSKKITFWGWGSPAEVKVYETLVEQYQKENEGVTIAYTHYESNTYMSKFQSEKKKPDVFFMPDTDFLSWADAGIMLELNDYVTDAEHNSVWAEAMNEYYYNRSTKTLGKSEGAKLYGFPKDLGPTCLVYNETLLNKQIEKNGLDKEEVYGLLNPKKAMGWKTFEKLLKDLTAGSDIYGIPYYEMDAALYCNNTNYFTDNATKENISSNEFIDSYWFNIRLATVDHVMPDSKTSGATDAYTRFFNGNTIFTWMGPWDNADFWDYKDLKYNIIPVPYNDENPDAESVSFVGSMCYGISADSKKKEEAVKFAKWLCMGETCQKTAMELGQQVPNLISMTNDYISAEWEVQPANRSLFVDIMDGKTNSIGLYSSASEDKISGKTRSSYFTYDTTWKDNFTSYIVSKNIYDCTTREQVAEIITGYKDKFQTDLNEMNSRWKNS